MAEFQEPFRPIKEVELFSDLNTKTPWTGSRVRNVNAVVRAIFSAIKQPPLQRMFDPSGFDLESLLFRLSSDAIEQQLKNYLDSVAQDDDRYEMVRNQTQILSADKDNNYLTIQIAFRLLPAGETVYTVIGGIRV